MNQTDPTAAHQPDGTDCPHCPDGHQRPDGGSQPWSAWVDSVRDVDGQPMQIIVARSAGAHVAESDAQWVRERLNAPVSYAAHLPLDHPLRRECRCSEAGVCRRCSEVSAGAAPAVVSPPTDRAAIRDRIAEAIWAQYSDAEPSRTGLVMANPHAVADAVLAVLPEAADRAAVLLEAANWMSRKAAKLTEGLDDLAIFVGKARAAEAEILNREAAELRRLAVEARSAGAQQQPAAEAWDAPDARPGTTDYTLQQQAAAADDEETRHGR